MSELLPCPFCGSHAVIGRQQDEDLWSHNTVTWTTVSCADCDASTGATCPGFEVEAIERWNRRAALAAQPGAVGEPLGYMNAGHVYELQQKRINYAYVYPNEEVGASVAIYSAAPTEAKPAQDAVDADTALLNWLRDESCDLRCISSPTGGDDYDIRWIVIEHHMAAPHEREIGESYTDEPRDAIRAAISAKKVG